ncbi:hypothetical protein PACTADRAFT_48330 [Pachysolen tannophilus NRRL Y-2460]|uniref:EamA domain-containing protein n=1 Tax=Pachysolen tannophilus NRRL Y-2460 TaxID=669874 RepID=A0A1E4U3N1_PACTA|nr:hypothetical protein PACTADRAFT_48330 [Pachysolen tannophilus NRRL Y-2460]
MTDRDRNASVGRGLLKDNDDNDSFELSIYDDSDNDETILGSSQLYKMKTILTSYYDRFVAPNIGLSLVCVAQFFNSLMNMSCKLLETDPDFEVPMNPFQILFARMSITYIMCFIYMYFAKTPDFPLGPKGLRKWLIMRGVTGFFGVFGMYFSLQYLSVSDATVLMFLGPSITGLAAYLILHETFTWIEGVGGIFSLLGVVLIARPTFIFGNETSSETDTNVETADPSKRILATFVAVLGAVGSGFVMIVIRYIGKRAHALLSVSYFSAYCCLVSFIAIMVTPSLTFQIPHTPRQWYYFILIGVSGFVMQFCLTAGVQREKAGRTALMTYTQMIYALFWEITVWYHFPPILSWIGFFIIIGSAACICYFKPKHEPPIEPNGIVRRERFVSEDDMESRGAEQNSVELENIGKLNHSANILNSNESLVNKKLHLNAGAVPKESSIKSSNSSSEASIITK